MIFVNSQNLNATKLPDHEVVIDVLLKCLAVQLLALNPAYLKVTRPISGLIDEHV